MCPLLGVDQRLLHLGLSILSAIKDMSAIKSMLFGMSAIGNFQCKQKRQKKLLKSRLLFNKIANFTKIKQLKCRIFMIPLKHVSDRLSALFQFA